jgi:hypothetical protein
LGKREERVGKKEKKRREEEVGTSRIKRSRKGFAGWMRVGGWEGGRRLQQVVVTGDKRQKKKNWYPANQANPSSRTPRRTYTQEHTGHKHIHTQAQSKKPHSTARLPNATKRTKENEYIIFLPFLLSPLPFFTPFSLAMTTDQRSGLPKTCRE